MCNFSCLCLTMHTPMNDTVKLHVSIKRLIFSQVSGPILAWKLMLARKIMKRVAC